MPDTKEEVIHYVNNSFMRLFALISVLAMLSSCAPIRHSSGKAEETQLNRGRELSGRYRGSYDYPKEALFTSAGCWLELIAIDGGEGRFIMGAMDGGWASAAPEFYDGTFVVLDDVVELHADRRYWAEDEWGHQFRELLDSTSHLFRLKLVKKGTSFKLFTDYPKKLELTKVPN